MNSYPYLDNKIRPIFTGELGDITPRVRSQRIIDISFSPLVLARDLRQKLQSLHVAGELDGGLPIVRDNVLVGLIPAPELEFALDKLEDEDSGVCLMAAGNSWPGWEEEDEEHEANLTDFAPYIDPVRFAIHRKYVKGWQKADGKGDCDSGTGCSRYSLADRPCV